MHQQQIEQLPNGEKKLIEASMSNVMQATNVTSDLLADSNDSSYIKGYDLNEGLDYAKLLRSYANTGFQASNLAKAINEVNRMVRLLFFFLIA
jgi:deoxyhypusine synthase